MDAIDLNGVKKNVYDVIKRNPRAADDDAILIERYWIEINGWDETKSLYWNIPQMTHPETITRRRRELHAAGIIKYSEDADKRRSNAFRNERERSAAEAQPKKEPGKAVPWMD